MKTVAVRVRLLLALSALGLMAMTGCASQIRNDKVQANLTEALRVAQNGDTARARYWADQAIAVDPNALSTYVATTDQQDGLTVASVFYAAGDLPTLRDYLKQAVAKFPNDYHAPALLSQIYGQLGDTKDQQATATALAALLEKKIVTPGAAHDKEMTLALAQAYCDAGNLAKGAADYQAVIHASPSDPDAYNGLAYAWAVADSKPDLPQARAYAQRAMMLAPKAGWPPEQLQEKMSGYQDTLGWVQYRQGDYQDALDNLQAAVNADPREAEERYHLGMVYEALNQPDAARAEFTHAALLSQGYQAPRIELARLKAPAPAKPAPTETAQR
ncbi:MAG: tetratricopeptide repeat protein [Armatimonadetes bacterium]|nr:tetratricopeptide repeat protein [Armatimonadota bacterium]